MRGERELSTAALERRLVGSIEGRFVVARYQRGYRWGDHEVRQLLDDVAGANRDYDLQPIVVMRAGDGKWELVDGQQRLTTLYLLLLYMHRAGLKNVGPRYTIEYETRERSAEYLRSLDEKRAGENIDFFHLHRAYRCIAAWFEAREPHARQLLADELFGRLFKSVYVIWYEAPPETDAVALFTRLNDGRIPLTDAELVKALVLSLARGGPVSTDRANEVAAQWDGIERDLRAPELWAFLSSLRPDEAPTRISLLLDVIADQLAPSSARRPPFHTFETLRAEIERTSWVAVWNRVIDLHARVLGWFDDRRVFHKIGYLVSVGQPLGELVGEAEKHGKSAFEAVLDDRIRASLGLTRASLLELDYERDGDRTKLARVLLLMNVLTVAALPSSSERYSFARHRSGTWSLEHIHAQHAQGLTKAEQWRGWLSLHGDALAKLRTDDDEARATVVAEIDRALARDELTGEVFRRLHVEVDRFFGSNEDAGPSGLHAVSNLALLDSGDNAALSNAAFEVKRRKILDLDRRGAYIPVCTRRVFLKYYTDADEAQLGFWGPQDREGYLAAMLEIVGDYLSGGTG